MKNLSCHLSMQYAKQVRKGIAACAQQGTVVVRADEGVYRAKLVGKNQVFSTLD